jgi:hypothetical protein
LTDILWNFASGVVFLIDIAYIVILILLCILKSSSLAELGVATFIISFMKLFTLYENLKLIEGNFINSFKKEQLFNLLKVGVFNIFFAHFVATILFAMSKIDL